MFKVGRFLKALIVSNLAHDNDTDNLFKCNIIPKKSTPRNNAYEKIPHKHTKSQSFIFSINNIF